MDPSVAPSEDFYRFAAGTWIRKNPVPADKTRWGGFGELREYNFHLLRSILEEAAGDSGAPPGSPRRQVGDFYAAALDSAGRDAARFGPIQPILDRIARARDRSSVLALAAELHDTGVEALFTTFVAPDRKDSGRYALYLMQGGLSLPDREYYLGADFEEVRRKFPGHVARMFSALGESDPEGSARTVLEIEMAFATPSRSATDLRDALKNYNPISFAELARSAPEFPWAAYWKARGIDASGGLVLGQPEFVTALGRELAQRPVDAWRTYLRWHLLRTAAPFLHRDAERADFEFFHGVLLGQKEEEPGWKRAAQVIDGALGEALGRLYVERHFPPEAKRRVEELVGDLRTVFRERLTELPWMSAATRAKALAKFDRFTAKIGHPATYRDYSSVAIRRDGYWENLRAASAFEVRRQLARIGGPVDRDEWHMTPPEVNAYFNPSQNEIVFPAGVLQPPFFDVAMDDAVNYGGIGAVIGHEITHGYDDQGRRFDAEGNLADWWSEGDAKEFNERARGVVEAYGAFEPLPGVRINGELTMGENIADLGGVGLAFEALRRRLAADPKRRREVDGLTPEQRFFVSFAQIWRENIREPDLRRRLTIDPHAPGRFRALGSVGNSDGFYAAFRIPKGSKMFRPKQRRVGVW